MPDNAEPVVELTQGAREAVDLIVDQVRSDILRRAAAIATDPSEDRVEVTGRDVRTAAEQILPSTRLKPRRRSALERVLLFYALLGLVLVAVAGIGLTIRTVGQTLDPITGLAATAAAAGALLAVVSLGAAYATRRSVEQRFQIEHRSAADPDDFLTQWALIEDRVRRLASVRLGDAAQDAPFSQLVATLHDYPGVSADDLTRLDNLRRMRNDLAHGRVVRLSESAITQANELLNRLLRAAESNH
jgi:hypothetical protein